MHWLRRLFAFVIFCAPGLGAAVAAEVGPPPIAAAPASATAAPAAPAARDALRPGVEQFLGCKKYPADKKFKWSVRGEVGVAELASSLGEISCRPILVASAIASRGGKVMLDVPDLVTAADVYRLFYGALEAMGLTIDASGGALKIVDAGRAREVATPELGDGAVGAGPGPVDDRFVVRLLHPHHATPAELAELLGKMKSKEGDVSVFGSASLVLIDRALNVRRMEELARALDVGEADARIYTLATHGQTPTELTTALEKLLSAVEHRPGGAGGDKGRAPGGGGAGAVATLDGDVRALVPLDNVRLLAVVGNDAGWQRVQAIAARLDPPSDEGASAKGHVLYLAHTNAEDLAQTLQSVGLGGRSGAGGSSAQRPPGTPGAPSASSPVAGSPLALTGDVRIGFDKSSNALIVYANAADFAAVRELVDRLDVPRRQVYVEAVIFDLSVDKLRTIGVSWHGINTDSSGNAGVVSNQSGTFATLSAQSLAAAASGAGLFAGVVGQSFSVLGQNVPSFAVALQALEHSKDANVISRPHLLTMDNTKATLSVGQVIPYPATSVSSPTLSVTQQTSYQRQPVTLSLELTPHLNESSSIRLEINSDIEDVADGATPSSAGGPTTNQRKLITSVVVRDGECVVLGGLTKETDAVTVDKIPLLGDIPLLGRLFQTRSKQRVKQELLIVLTPYIIRGPEDLRRIQQQKEEERREFLERYSAFTGSAYEDHVDYRRKRGLLEEVNVTAQAAEREADALRAAERQLRPRRTDGPIAFEPAN